MTSALIAFAHELLKEAITCPSDPEPLLLTKDFALREVFVPPTTIKEFCRLFDVEFSHFKLSEREHVTYYSFRMRPELNPTEDDTL